MHKLTMRYVYISAFIFYLFSYQYQLFAQPFSNEGFETGDFTGWQTIGEASVETLASGVAPNEGNYDAFIQNHVDNPGIPVSQLETFGGLPLGSLTGLGAGEAVQGSAIKRTVVAKAGDKYTFYYNLVTAENEFGVGVRDFAFVAVIPGSVEILSDVDQAMDLSPLALFPAMTGYKPHEITFQNDGTYSVVIGVVDVEDDFGPTALFVDTVPIPEPTTGGIVGAFFTWFLSRFRACHGSNNNR